MLKYNSLHWLSSIVSVFLATENKKKEWDLKRTPQYQYVSLTIYFLGERYTQRSRDSAYISLIWTRTPIDMMIPTAFGLILCRADNLGPRRTLWIVIISAYLAFSNLVLALHTRQALRSAKDHVDS